MSFAFARTMLQSVLGLGALAAVIGLLAQAAEKGVFDSRYEEPAMKVFGTKSGKAIETGFLFKDGVYVDAPYVVSNRGVDIYVNEVQVAALGKWPPVDYADKKPEMPSGLTRQSTFADLAIASRPGDSLDRQMIRWLRRHYDDEQAQRLITGYYKSLPFVKEVTLDKSLDSGGRMLAISTWSDKDDMVMDIGEPVWVPPTPEQVQKELERVRARMETRLKRGECIFAFGGGGELAFGSRKAAMDLTAIVRTLRGEKPEDQKIKELQKRGLLPPHVPKEWQVLVTDFCASPQLDERAKKLRLPPGDAGERHPTPEEEAARVERRMMEEKARETESKK